MRLTQFTIQNYKIIDDTGPVQADPNVTALVGKNESGETGVLRALWKSRNRASAEFDKLMTIRAAGIRASGRARNGLF
jgi:predicted ATP-dependent endonuclease of OLD family